MINEKQPQDYKIIRTYQNSKGIIVFSIGMFLLILLITSCIITREIHQESRDNACKEIGLEKYIFRRGQDYCEDKSYNLHYVKIIDNSFWGLLIIFFILKFKMKTTITRFIIRS